MYVGETKPKGSVVQTAHQQPALWVVYVAGAIPVTAVAFPLPVGTTPIGRKPGQGGLALDDEHMSRAHAELTVADDGTAMIRDLGSVNGTFVDGVSRTAMRLVDGAALRIGDSLLVYRAAQQAPGALGVGANSPAACRLDKMVRMVARSEASVILLGESGTGKEVAARRIHELSGKSGPFVAVNCSAIPEALAESQLFGHIQGSFTGAVKPHAGFFRSADGGTLFLDELGDLPASIQPKLLRALEERCVTPIGMSDAIAFDGRVVCATESHLQQAIDSDQFRGALYARLADLTIELEPLRKRREDILELFTIFLGPRQGEVGPELAERLLAYRWPFNVRELKKVAAELNLRAAGDELLTLEMVTHRLVMSNEHRSMPPPPVRPEPTSRDPDATTRHDIPAPSKEQLDALMRTYRGTVARVAEHTGRSRKQVYRWLRDHGLSVDMYRA